MYEFYYHKLQPYFNNKSKLHYMYTESYILSLDNFKTEFDSGELDKSHELYDTINKHVLGKMKRETSPIIELDNFVALISKSYSFSYKDMQSDIQKQNKKEYNIHHKTNNL